MAKLYMKEYMIKIYLKICKDKQKVSIIKNVMVVLVEASAKMTILTQLIVLYIIVIT